MEILERGAGQGDPNDITPVVDKLLLAVVGYKPAFPESFTNCRKAILNAAREIVTEQKKEKLEQQQQQQRRQQQGNGTR